MTCEYCGAETTEGVMIGDQPLYTHTCEALVAAKQEQDRQDSIRYARHIRVQNSNLPADVDGIGDLAGYRARFGVSQDTRCGIELCEAFLQSCRDGKAPDGFTLRGAAGVGKSTLTAALARSLLAAGVEVRWEVAPRLYNRLLAAFWNHELEYEFDRLLRYRVLILDDLGREKPTPWWVDQVLFPLVDGRKGRPVIATSNYTWGELQTLYAAARNETEQAHSAPYLIDRLQECSASFQFGGDTSHRTEQVRFLRGPH